MNHKGGLDDKYFQRQINSVLFKNATDEKQLKKLLSIKKNEAFTLPQRISNGLVEMYSTIGVTLFFFVIIFSINLEPRS